MLPLRFLQGKADLVFYLDRIREMLDATKAFNAPIRDPRRVITPGCALSDKLPPN